MMKGPGEASGVVTFSFPMDQLIVKASVFLLTLPLAHQHQSKIPAKIEMVGSFLLRWLPTVLTISTPEEG